MTIKLRAHDSGRTMRSRCCPFLTVSSTVRRRVYETWASPRIEPEEVRTCEACYWFCLTTMFVAKNVESSASKPDDILTAPNCRAIGSNAGLILRVASPEAPAPESTMCAFGDDALMF